MNSVESFLNKKPSECFCNGQQVSYSDIKQIVTFYSDMCMLRGLMEDDISSIVFNGFNEEVNIFFCYDSQVNIIIKGKNDKVSYLLKYK